MADLINTFDARTGDARSCGLVQPVVGDGFAVTVDPANGKRRYDVWDGDWHICVPIIGHTPERESAALIRLGADARRQGDGALRKATAFVRALLAANG